ncbi:hypothetical protein FACS1894216_16030 [Synergistales bacterium]|nr:hypothetical protein FACS1894216_16030 [Synergistales bacterium]
MSYTVLLPKTDNSPAKVKDAGVVEMVKAGLAVYNAKSSSLLFLPEGTRELDGAAARLADNLFEGAGIQPLDCGGDEAIFSVADRYAREWGDAARAFSDKRGRSIRLLGWEPDAEAARAKTKLIMSAIENALREHAGKFSFIEEIAADGARSFLLTAKGGQSDMGARAAFECASCGRKFLPDSPAEFNAPQPGANEAEEPIEDVETPGANTIAELCRQLGIDVPRTIKAMLYIALDEASKPRPVAAFLRGDYSVSMNKLRRMIETRFGFTGLRTADKAELYQMIGEVAGFCGPVGLPDNVTVVCDASARGAKNTVAGANRPGYHRKGCCHGRDFDPPMGDIAQITESIACPCGGALSQIYLRECGAVRFDAVSHAAGTTRRKLSYRDRDGSRDFTGEWDGNIFIDRILLAAHG